MATKLSATNCETVKPNPLRDRLLGDGDGLSLRVRPNGTKTWIIEYVFKGRRTKYTIGAYSRAGAPEKSISEWLRHGQLSLSQARSIAGEWKAARRAGHDPAEEWQSMLDSERKAAQLESEQPTVTDAIEIFMAKIMNGKKSAPAIRYRLERLGGSIGGKKIRDVTRQDIIKALDSIATGMKEGGTAKQLTGEVLTTSKRLWRFAAEREWVAESCIETLTRAAFDAKPNKRDVTLRLDELAVVWRTLSDDSKCKSDPVTVAAMKVLILTGQRENEVCGASWDEFDLPAGLWRIPADRTKTKKAHLVHLAPQAMEVLELMQAINGKRRHVFASPLKPEQPIHGRSVNNALLTLFKSGALQGVTQCHVHDFRRTLISRLPDLGFPFFLGHKIANHAMTGVFSHYNHNTYEAERKAALMAWAERVDAMASGSNVIEFRKAK